MELNTLSDKNLQEVERLAKELLLLLNKTALKNHPLSESLYHLEIAAGDIRRARFDASDPEYSQV